MQEELDRKTIANLESAIPQSNIGFKLLKEMGYTPGSTLVKEGSGLAEPVGLEIWRTRDGIGREDSRKEKRRREEERVEWDRGKEEALMEDLGCRQKEQWRSRRVVVNYHKAKAVLEQWENKEVVAEAEKVEEDGENEEEEEITEEMAQSGLLALGSKRGDLAIVKLATNETTHRQSAANAINRVEFSPDGKFLFASGRGLYKLPVEDLNKVIQFYGHTGVIGDFCLEWEHHVYICSPRRIQLLDLRLASPYHTFVPKRQTSCIDILSSENVLLSGDSMGFLNRWNLRMMKEECSLVTLVPSIKKKTGITSIAVCPDSSWICAGTKGGDVYEYKYGDERCMFQHAIPGKQKEVKNSVVQVTFPRAATGPAVVAFEEFIGQYDPSEYKPNDTKITWTKEISSGIDGSKISCCTVDPYSTVFFSGHTSGHVISYTLDSDHIRTLPIRYDGGGGAITSLDFVHT